MTQVRPLKLQKWGQLREKKAMFLMIVNCYNDRYFSLILELDQTPTRVGFDVTTLLSVEGEDYRYLFNEENK
jgi:hypothetical protein